jgi:hypothetical protein
MKYFIATLLLYKFDAGTIWWVLFVVIAMMDILGISYTLYTSRKKTPIQEPILKDIVKLDGTPYSYEDLQNIWNNGYDNGYENAQLKKH